jgi:propionyl-CoA synthetase
VIISASCGLEPNRIVEYKPAVDEAVRLSGGAPRQLILQREEWRCNVGATDLVWQDTVPGAAHHDCVAVESDHPLYVLYTR